MPSLGDLFKTMDIVTKAVLEAALKEFPCKNKSEKHCSHCPFGLTCENPEMRFPCVCKHVRNNPGTRVYSCEYCGLFTASRARCNKCEELQENLKFRKCIHCSNSGLQDAERNESVCEECEE